MAETFIVIGGGLVGAACAYRLQAAGRDVILIDVGPAGAAASFGNAGHIATEQIEPLANWATIRSAPRMLFGLGGPLDFRLSDIGAWGPWAARFLASSGGETFRTGKQVLGGLMARAVEAWEDLLTETGDARLMQTDGHAILWLTTAEVDKGRAAWAQTDIGTARTRPLRQAELETYAALIPKRPPVGGFCFEGPARLVSPQQAREALLNAFERRGGRRVNGTVTSLSAEGAVIVDRSTELQADQILVAAGVRSGALLSPLGIRAPLIAERGYSIRIPELRWPPGVPTAIIEDQSMVLAPHAEGLRATSYVEFGRPDSQPDPRKWRRLEFRLSALGIPVPNDIQRWMGCRPTLPDYVPGIGRARGAPRVLYAVGHQHLGVTLAAVTAERVLALADGAAGDPRLDLERFR